jgi:hypothetical protein
VPLAELSNLVLIFLMAAAVYTHVVLRDGHFLVPSLSLSLALSRVRVRVRASSRSLQCVVCTACVNCGGVSGRGRRRRVWRPHACRQRIVTCNMRDMLARSRRTYTERALCKCALCYRCKCGCVA